MLKRFTYFLLLVFVASTLTTCKKYPEGPNFTLRTAMCRITGVWDVTYYEANGIDSTSYVFNSPCYCRYYFSKSRSGDNSYDLSLRSVDSLGYCGSGGEWSFYNKYKNVEIVIAGYAGSFSPIGAYGRTACWEIQKLTKEELWLKNDKCVDNLAHHN